MNLPRPRGPLSTDVFAALSGEPRPLPHVGRLPLPRSDDFQITLWVLQQLSFRPVDGVSPWWEAEPSFVELRRTLELAQEAELRRELRIPTTDARTAIDQLVHTDGVSLSKWMEDHGELRHMREFVAHRAAYQLQEADPHSFAIPRLPAGRAKTALLKIQLDEYGDGEAGESHQELFGVTMRELGVDFDIDELPWVTLRTNTVLNALTSERRLLGGLVGHLAVFEMTSVTPMARYAATLRRVLPEPSATTAARFYDVHVAADGFHGRIALEELVDGFVEQYPDESAEVIFGAMAVSAVECEFACHLIRSWETGRSSLRRQELQRAA